MNVIIGLIEAKTPTMRYTYQFKLNSGSQSFAIIRAIAKPANPFNLKSINEN